MSSGLPWAALACCLNPEPETLNPKPGLPWAALACCCRGAVEACCCRGSRKALYRKRLLLHFLHFFVLASPQQSARQSARQSRRVQGRPRCSQVSMRGPYVCPLCVSSMRVPLCVSPMCPALCSSAEYHLKEILIRHPKLSPSLSLCLSLSRALSLCPM